MQVWYMNGAGNDFMVIETDAGLVYGEITSIYLEGPTEVTKVFDI